MKEEEKKRVSPASKRGGGPAASTRGPSMAKGREEKGEAKAGKGFTEVSRKKKYTTIGLKKERKLSKPLNWQDSKLF